ncbi:hypothetical protein [Streptomyces cylindrosporus]|uniref:Uncharacterized protein n=1 Tax=Streptomyces cylindrosporus TaxID=2927583 RepID=A0ABS9YCV2_9ACTN|nr:hypothetical protein [Streptomyces cylindrosporus]MCI3275067.1 hypothetical protein [Streptomyces cylindrosporus]
MAVDGTWTITFDTPAGEQQAELVLDTASGALTGELNGTPIEDGQLNGDEIKFVARITEPIKLKVKCGATVAGDTMTGKAKATLMSIAFTGTRAAD